MKYKLIIFDFDGTLAHTLPWLVSVINQVAEKYNFRQIQEHEVEMLRGWSADRVLKYLHVPTLKLPFIATYLRSLMANEMHKIHLFDGVSNMLKMLHERGALLGAVSSNSTANVRTGMGPDNSSRFRWYECGVALFGKAAKLKHVQRRADVKPDEAIYIGDEITDVVAAHKAHIASGAVSWGFNSLESLKAESPTIVFDSVEDIVEKIA